MPIAMTRSEHLAWCKQRAKEYLPADPQEALISMFSDLKGHPETANHGAIVLGTMLLMAGHLSSASEVEKFIDGFN